MRGLEWEDAADGVMRHSLKYQLSLSERVRTVARFLVLKKKEEKKKNEKNVAIRL